MGGHITEGECDCPAEQTHCEWETCPRAKKMADASQPSQDAAVGRSELDPSSGHQYEAGDVRAVELGEFTTRDGREIHGVLIDFPAGPPPLPLSVIFQGTPLTLTIKSQPAK